MARRLIRQTTCPWSPGRRSPEPRDKMRSNSGESGRERPRGAQPPPPSGRRQLRIAGRPQSAAGPVQHPPDDHPHTHPASAGRNRLQRKANRMSALPSGSPAGSSPLTPISSHSYNADSGFTPPRPTRSSTWDYPSENHAPGYGGSPGGGTVRGAPAPPPKVPIPTMSGALVSAGGGGVRRTGRLWRR